MSWGVCETLKEAGINYTLFQAKGFLKLYNEQIFEASRSLSESPTTWNGGQTFQVIESIHKSVILPIAGSLLCLFILWDMYQIITSKNNLSEVDTWQFFKWILSAYIGVKLLTNSMNITMGIIDIGNFIVQKASISTEVMGAELFDFSKLEESLREVEAYNFVQIFRIGLTIRMFKLFFNASSLIVWVFTTGRILRMYFYIALAAIPFSTFTSSEHRNMFFNYLKNILALALHGLLIILSFSIYKNMIVGIGITTINDGSVMNPIFFKVSGTTLLLLLMLFKTEGISKSIVGAS